jgi:hypothetical protein
MRQHRQLELLSGEDCRLHGIREDSELHAYRNLNGVSHMNLFFEKQDVKFRSGLN